MYCTLFPFYIVVRCVLFLFVVIVVQDMNEPSNFRDGAAAEAVCDMSNPLNSPPYIPGV